MFAQVRQERPIRVQLACSAQLLHMFIGGNLVNQHPTQRTVGDALLINQSCNEADRTHLSHQRGVEADLVDSVQDLACASRNVVTVNGIDMNDYNVSAVAAVVAERRIELLRSGHRLRTHSTSRQFALGSN